MTKKRSTNAFLIFIAVEIVIMITAVLVDGVTLDALQTATRFSGRLSLLFFSCMLLLMGQQNNEKILSSKPFLLFAILHGIHLIQLLFFVTLSQRTLIPIRVLGGFVAYLIIFIAPIVAYLQARGSISAKAFRSFRFVYFPYIWFIFFMSYLPRVTGSLKDVGGAYWEHVTLFCIVIIVGIVGFFVVRPKLAVAVVQQP